MPSAIQLDKMEDDIVNNLDSSVLNAIVEEVLSNHNKSTNKSTGSSLNEQFEANKTEFDLEEFEAYYQEECEHELNAMNAMNANLKPVFFPKSLFLSTPQNCRSQLNKESFLDHDQIPEPRFLPIDHDKRLLDDHAAQQQYNPNDFAYDMSFSGEMGGLYPIPISFVEDNSNCPGMAHKSTSGFVFPQKTGSVTKTTIQTFIEKAMKSEEQLNNLMSEKLTTNTTDLVNNKDEQVCIKLYSNKNAGNDSVDRLSKISKTELNDNSTKESNSYANINIIGSCSTLENSHQKLNATKLNDLLGRVEETTVPFGEVQLRRTKSLDAIRNKKEKNEIKEAATTTGPVTSDKGSQSPFTLVKSDLTRTMETATQTSEHVVERENETISELKIRTLPVLKFLPVTEGSKHKRNETSKKKKSKVSCLNALGIFRRRLRGPQNENAADASDESDGD